MFSSAILREYLVLQDATVDSVHIAEADVRQGTRKGHGVAAVTARGQTDDQDILKLDLLSEWTW